MPTTVLDAYSVAYPDISNRIRASVYLETAPLAVVASIIDTTDGHPQRTWHFPGLERANYKFMLSEIDGSSNIVSVLALFDVVPGKLDGELCRKDEQIQVDVTPGLVSDQTGFVADGTDGAPDYRGWDIIPSELNGRGILIEGTDYSWDESTGQFALLIAGDLLRNGQWYNISFNCREEEAGGSVPSTRDFPINIIVTDTNLDDTFFGGKLIVEPNDTFITVTLPDIDTIVPGRPLMVEITNSDTDCCVQFVSSLGQLIKFLRGAVYAMDGESFWIYRLQREDSSNEWRVSECDGNFKNVGMEVSEDFTQDDVINKLALDGSTKDKFQYARLYNEFVLNLPAEQVVAFDQWAIGNNKYLYSLASGNDFHLPDRRGITARNNNAGKAGDYNDDAMIDHKHVTPIGTLITTLYGRAPVNVTHGIYNGTGFGLRDLTSQIVDADGNPITKVGDEVMVKNYLINKYVLC